ncbi:hypothetical protein ACJIZ3_000856 [Penstemon smallii]|uniref:Uncharacterized protein n=1 Tax=Penstemon smallii TaxID=265156 RepID=A0ABD3U5H5_9LAMI
MGKLGHKLIAEKKVPPRIELGLLDSESNVLTARPWDLVGAKELKRDENGFGTLDHRLCGHLMWHLYYK